VINPPRLSTERLLLDPLGLHHSEGMFLLWSREEVCRYSGSAVDAAGNPLVLPATSHADSDKIIEFFQHAAASGHGLRWALVGLQDHEFIGTVGFNSLSPSAELAFHLRPEYWGRGLMREAAEAALAWLWALHPNLPAEAFIEPRNGPSIALAHRLGFRATGVVREGAGEYVAAAAHTQRDSN